MIASELSSAPCHRRPSAVVVDPSSADARFFATVLAADGFVVQAVEGFAAAGRLLETGAPALILTEIRLGRYNGLQLVLRAMEQDAALVALVTSRAMDPVLQRDAEAMGATFFVKPIDAGDLRALVWRMAAREADRGRGPIRPPFERRQGGDGGRHPMGQAAERRRHAMGGEWIGCSARPLRP
jgi:DNA-binding response OmpR family regulator